MGAYVTFNSDTGMRDDGSYVFQGIPYKSCLPSKNSARASFHPNYSFILITSQITTSQQKEYQTFGVIIPLVTRLLLQKEINTIKTYFSAIFSLS